MDDASHPGPPGDGPSDRFATLLSGKLELLRGAYLERWLEHPEDVPPGLLESIELARERLGR
jgi:hypothetical protein